MEARRNARVATRFLVAIEGIEKDLVPRAGDISASGVYFEIDRDVGDVGTVQWLRLASLDGERALNLMAYVVRRVTLNEVGAAPRSGVAFEFMPESDAAQEALHDFVFHVLASSADGAVIAPRLPAKARSSSVANEAAATLQSLSVRAMTLEASWAVAPGERVRIEILAPGMTRRIRLEGRAARVTPTESGRTRRYKIDVQVQAETRRPLRRPSSMTFAAVNGERAARAQAEVSALGELGEDDMSNALDDLLSALVLPPAPTDAARPRREHLSGELARVRLTTLCSLFEMDRMSGVLTLSREREDARIYVADGQLVDVEPSPADLTPRAAIGRLLAWDEGTFHFSVEPVSRPNRIGVGTTALLLDLARESDERGRG